MTPSLRTATATVAIGFACLVAATNASAQYYGTSNNFAPSGSQAYARSASGSGGNFTYSPYVGWGGSVGATPWSSTYGSWISPAASASSQDAIALSQADLSSRFMYQDLKSKRLEHRRAVFDEMRYEKENTPTDEELRQEMKTQQLMRSRNNPPEGEIWTGAPLNDLLVSVQRTQARESVTGYSIPLDPDLVRHINVTASQDSRGSNASFKQDQLQQWPEAFADDMFADEKKRLQDDLNEMMKSQMEGRVNSAKTSDARKALATIREKLYSIRFQVSTQDYIDGLTYLSQAGDTVTTLSKPGAKNYLDGTYSAKGDTVGDLLGYMTAKGLKFAKASPGFEAYYTALYQQVVTYELGLNRLVGRK